MQGTIKYYNAQLKLMKQKPLLKLFPANWLKNGKIRFFVVGSGEHFLKYKWTKNYLIGAISNS